MRGLITTKSTSSASATLRDSALHSRYPRSAGTLVGYGSPVENTSFPELPGGVSDTLQHISNFTDLAFQQ